MSRNYPKTSKSLSFPNALVGNPDEAMTGPPTETFGGDNFGITSSTLSLQSILILDGARTAIGSPFKSLKDFSAAQLGAVVIENILKRAKIPKRFIGEVIFGNVVSAGTGQNLSRQVAILAGLPVEVDAFTVNQVCGSGLRSLIAGAHSIMCGETKMVIAGATESVSWNPALYFHNEGDDVSASEKKKVESLVYDGLWCHLSEQHMGHLAEFIAQEYKISRRAQDEYALRSHQKACRAQSEGKFLKEIAPVAISETKRFEEDERPRRNINREKLGALPPAFKRDGTVTAGNSSAPCDGAAAAVLAQEGFVKHNRLTPRAKILGYASVAVEPRKVFAAGIGAIQECFKKSRLTVQEIDLFEISEAFAAQAILTQQAIGIPEEKINVWGGDIALGHPLGAAGMRGLVTLIHALKDRKKNKGIVSVCLGGGGAIALAIEVIP